MTLALAHPIQGEQWQGGLSFPTPAIVTASFPVWFPHLPAKTLAAVERLYAGGSYTQSRLVQHTLMHYKSFERLLIVRIGPSIARRIALEEVVASGGPTVASQITLVERLLTLTLALILALILALPPTRSSRPARKAARGSGRSGQCSMTLPRPRRRSAYQQ